VSTECVGFPLPAPTGRLPETVQRWLGEHSHPIVFTPGTGVADIQAFFHHARECCRRLQRPAIFLSPHLSSEDARDEGLLSLPYLDLGLVLPHASLLVHHGGIGTTARAFQAGIPQVISPQAFDQPDNAHRVQQLGAGTMIARPELSGERLSEAAARLLGSTETSGIVRDLSRRCVQSDAIGALVDILEQSFPADQPVGSRRSPADTGAANTRAAAAPT